MDAYKIAKVLRQFKDKIDGVVFYHLVSAFADFLPIRDRQRFIKLCRCDHLPPSPPPSPPLPDHLKDCEILPF